VSSHRARPARSRRRAPIVLPRSSRKGFRKRKDVSGRLRMGSMSIWNTVAVVEFADVCLAMLSARSPVRGGDDPHVGPERARASKPLEFPFLENLKNLA